MNGRPSCPVRLMVALHYLKYAGGMSDESVLGEWLENPYWQYFTGGTYFEHEYPADQSTVSRWHKKFEFGTKVGFVTSSRSNWIVGRKHIPIILMMGIPQKFLVLSRKWRFATSVIAVTITKVNAIFKLSTVSGNGYHSHFAAGEIGVPRLNR